MITLYAILGINEVPNAFTRMHETFEAAEIELDRLFLNRPEKAMESLSKMELCVCEIRTDSKLFTIWQKAVIAHRDLIEKCEYNRS